MYTVEQLTAAGGKFWQSGEKRRVYFNEPELSKLIGLEVGYYGTGNISWSRYKGESISHGRARKMLDALNQLWYDLTDGKFYSRSRELDIVREATDAIRADIERSQSQPEQPHPAMGAAHYAVYSDEAIYGVGETPADAMTDAREWTDAGDLIEMQIDQQYPDGNQVIDMINVRRLDSDSESARGKLKLRRCDATLAAAVIASDGRTVSFEIDDRGVLVKAEDAD